MRKQAFLTGLIVFLFAAPSVFAQDRDRDRRRRPPPPPPPEEVAPPPPVKASPTPSVRDWTPKSGPPGTTVRIRGNHLDGVEVIFGRRQVATSQAGRRSVSFVVPDGRPGSRSISLRYDGTDLALGQFDLLSAGPEPGYTEPPPPVGGPPPRRGGRFADRPVVSSYWPREGLAGTDVSIRGRNFSNDIAVYYGGREVRPSRVRPNEIRFRVPRGAGSDVVLLRYPGGRRDLVVGQFEVTRAKFDRRSYDSELRDHGKRRWQERRAKLAADEAARLEALRLEEERLARERERRRHQRRAAIQKRFERAFLAEPEVQIELSIHAERMARLARMLRIAEARFQEDRVIRIEIASERERRRHDRRMNALRTSYAAR